MLSFIGEDSADETRCQWSAVASEAAVLASGYSEKTGSDLLKARALQVRRVKRIALIKIAGLVAAAKPAGTLF